MNAKEERRREGEWRNIYIPQREAISSLLDKTLI